MVKIEEFKVSYRPSDNIGVIHLALADNTGISLTIDNPTWADFLFKLLLHEKDVYYDREHDLVTMGLEAPGHHENMSSDAMK
ncbi:MAG: hypothetical protein DHS20C18_55150 [Saprospiraceae bacterium]|nr:MAG: hypothetical protein DHS20C18_55150 [Saprospiraceae bacterium]